MAGILDEYFVGIGVKGQNVVLSNIAKVKKEAKSLSKIIPTLNMSKGLISKIVPSAKPMPVSPEQKKEDKTQKDNSKNFKDATRQFAGSTKDFANSASTFDPLNVIKSATSGLGEALSGVTVLGTSLGQLPKGIADVTNALVDMAAGALRMAKESAAAEYGLTRRNATTKYYGGNDLEKGRMSNQEHADLVMSISGSYGKLQKPMLDVLNKLVDNKDTEALKRVASGNWESTGTDKGWILQQISNQTAGLPPSIVQAIQTTLLKNNANLIQSNEGEEGQAINASYERQGEAQTRRMYQVTSANFDNFEKMNSNLNDMQVQLVNTGVQFASSIVTATNALAKLPETINKIQSKIDSLLNKMPEWARPDMVRFGK